MKIQSVRLLAGTLAILAFSAINSTVFAQGTAFTYQGQLQNTGSPAYGTYNLQFTLYTISSGGAAVAGPVTTNGVVISNGLFTVTIDFGASVWNGETNWLQIGVETNGGGSFTSLTPRQQLTPTPYAIYAEGANALGLSGTIPAGNLTGTYGDVVDFSNPGNIFVGNGAGLLNVNATLLNGLTSSNFWQTTGNAGTTAGPNYVGTSDNVPLFLDSFGERGLELQFTSRSLYPIVGNLQAMNIAGGYWGNTVSNTVIGGTIAGGGDQEFILQLGGGGESYYPNIIGGDFGTVGGGYANTVTGYGGTIPGGYENLVTGQAGFAAGSYAQALHSGSFVWSDGTATYASTGPNQFLVRATGGVGIDTVAAPQQDLSVRGGLNIDQANDNSGFINNGSTNGYGLTFGSASGEGIASKRTAGGNQYGLDFYTGFSDKMSLDNGGDLTINGGQLFLTSGSTTSVGNGLGYWFGLPPNNIPGGNGPFLYGLDGGALGATDPTTICLSWDYSGDVWVSNNCSVASLTIRGGADLAEPFPMSAAQSEMQPGCVVVIDDQHPGQLKLSDQPYDTRVAGVVSGANGIHPGIQMQQQGLLGGGKNVALTGRVYVRVDASYGAIRPGDFLTTSATPGYAMKVTDRGRAQGAILGKAMTGLSQGTGMVLVLVTLQ
ncbi:MAG TPA: hypothetical protein VGY56_07920 [Verrucomicrobiae bacterium]|nr:hypothetical protein [Verrucomicrobiae bacterium]